MGQEAFVVSCIKATQKNDGKHFYLELWIKLKDPSAGIKLKASHLSFHVEGTDDWTKCCFDPIKQSTCTTSVGGYPQNSQYCFRTPLNKETYYKIRSGRTEVRFSVAQYDEPIKPKWAVTLENGEWVNNHLHRGE